MLLFWIESEKEEIFAKKLRIVQNNARNVLEKNMRICRVSIVKKNLLLKMIKTKKKLVSEDKNQNSEKKNKILSQNSENQKSEKKS